MPNQKNIHQLAELIKGLSDSKAVILTEYAGLSVSEQNQLRNEASKNDAVFVVTKNNLLRLALKETNADLVDTLDSFLNGPTAVLFSKKDAVAGAKIKSGIMDGKAITPVEITSLSKLPSREQLLSSLLAQLQAPAQALVRQLSAPIQNLVYGLDALRNKLSA